MPNETSRAALVVDDEPAGLETACMMFEAFGFVVHRASNATESLRLLNSPVHFDLSVNRRRLTRAILLENSLTDARIVRATETIG